jgi:hypothetical protein
MAPSKYSMRIRIDGGVPFFVIICPGAHMMASGIGTILIKVDDGISSFQPEVVGAELLHLSGFGY